MLHYQVPGDTTCIPTHIPTSNKHGADREDLLSVSISGDIAEAHAGQTAEGEVEWRDVHTAQWGAALGWAIHCGVGDLQTLPQLM